MNEILNVEMTNVEVAQSVTSVTEVDAIRASHFEYDGKTVYRFNGHDFVAVSKESGVGSGKKTILTLRLLDTAATTLTGDVTTLTRRLGGEVVATRRTIAQQAGTIEDYTAKIVRLFDKGEDATEQQRTRLAEVVEVCEMLNALATRYRQEDDAARQESDTLDYLKGLDADALAALLAKIGK